MIQEKKVLEKVITGIMLSDIEFIEAMICRSLTDFKVTATLNNPSFEGGYTWTLKLEEL